MSEKEDTYHDTILDLEAKLKKNVDLFLKLGNSLQGMFMLGPKPLSVYDQQLKHGLGYPNPYTLKQAISKCPKLVKGWLDEDLEYYHLKELHYSAQCHTQMSLWIISRGVVLLILLMEYKFQVWYIELTSPSDHSNSRKNTRTLLKNRDVFWGEAESETSLKESMKKAFQDMLMDWGEVKFIMHTTMVQEQVKTMKIQAGIQVLRRGELRRQLQLWKRFGRLYYVVICTC
ncbi:hypothetical protein Tco_1121663 [Tanacetum coccineum]|uniref:Uncharacterized protein n=1 Tax=Tanacetum coccineum TaxID=301880 RepID=A0ABQ5J103_9ASTR